MSTGETDMVTMDTVVTLEGVGRKLLVLGDALIGNASLAQAQDAVTTPLVFLSLYEHAVEIRRMVEVLAAARATDKMLTESERDYPEV